VRCAREAGDPAIYHQDRLRVLGPAWLLWQDRQEAAGCQIPDVLLQVASSPRVAIPLKAN
jgi:hypothetical protein